MTGRDRLYRWALNDTTRDLADLLERERELRGRIDSLLDALAPLRPTERVVDEVEGVTQRRENIGLEGHD